MIRREKLSINCNVPIDCVIAAPDADSIYEIPLNFEKDNLGERILEKLGLPNKKENNDAWRKLVQATKVKGPIVNIGIVSKYFASGDFELSDSYISVIEAIKHAAA